MNNYYFGNGNSKYKDVLTCLSTTEVKSYETSSLPLAQFWNPDNKELKLFYKKCKAVGLDLSKGHRYFEYPTPCLNNEGKCLKNSHPSMTDLMIINDKEQIAIEGKYTEYSKGKYETINEWLENKPHKKEIKDQWFKYIYDCGATKKTKIQNNIPYQFLHRTASACFCCSEKNPILIYQLFYDSRNKAKKDEFISNLQKWAKELGFTKKIKFFIIEVEIKNIKEVKEKYDKNHADLFLIMRETEKPIYEFDWENIKVKEVISEN